MQDIEKGFLDNRTREKDMWRMFRIISDFTDAYEEFSTLPPAVSIFGSARTPKNNRYYKMAVKIAKILSSKGLVYHLSYVLTTVPLIQTLCHLGYYTMLLH